jgi:hypothetical protein
MKSRDFVYWLQGYAELTENASPPSAEQWQKIKNHLNMVFKHEIDPSNGTPEHNKELSELHRGGPPGSVSLGKLLEQKLGLETHLNC